MPKLVEPCRLCLRKLPLRDSHIIPEWLYKALYDDKHRYRVVEAGKGHQTLFGQKGIRERLLCQECETALSVYEGYARGVLVGGVGLEIQKLTDGFQVHNLEYAKLKLFQLSVLWRAGVAGHSFFSEVTLGSHAETLRKMLLASDPGAATDYGCILVPVVADGQLVTDLITQPLLEVVSGWQILRLVLGGHAWIFVLGDGKSHPFAKLFLDPTGTLQVRLGGKAVDGYLRGLARTFVPENGLAI